MKDEPPTTKPPSPIDPQEIHDEIAARDRLWCLALLQALDPREMQAVLESFNDLRDHPGVADLTGASFHGIR